MSAPYIDVRAALDAAGIRYTRSGNWLRCRAIWRDSKDADLAIHSETGVWKDHGGGGEHGGWRQLCELLGIYNPNASSAWTEADRAAWRARKESRKAEEAKDASRRMRAAMSLWERRSVSLDRPTDKNAAAMRDYIQYRGLRLETLMQVARAGQSNGLPCLVYGRWDPRTGKITTVHREWDKRTWPARKGSNKRGLGPQFWSNQTAYIEYNRWDGAPVAPGAMAAIAEGQLSAACAAELYPGSPVISTFTMGGIERPPAARIKELVEAGFTILILGDRGGMKAAQECARQILLACPGAKIRIAVPPEERVEGQKKGEDWLDVRVGYEGVGGLGDEATRELIEQHATVPDTPSVTPMIPWRRRQDAPERPTLPPLKDMQAELHAALPGAIEAAIQGQPVLIMTPPGGGKSWGTLEALLAARVPVLNEESEPCGDRPVNFLWATATKGLAHEAFHMAGACPIDMEWDGRGVEGLCNRPVATKCLMDRGRSPHQNACMKCEFGVKPKGDDNDERCQFQKNLSGAPYMRGIFGQHGIVGKESTLLKWAADPRDDFQDRDVLVIDEGVPTFSKGEVRIDDVTGARVATGAIEDHIAHLKNRNKKHKRGLVSEDDDEERFSEDDFQKARDWAATIAPHLDALGLHLVQAATEGAGLRALDAQCWAEFAKLAMHIPPAARAADASALEKVQDIFGDKRVVPLAWIAALGRAVQAGTAWVRVGKDGTVILVYTNPSDLWTRYLKKGGLLLDASCTHVDEILAAGGVVIDLRCAQPNLKVIQYGPLLHGKGDSGASEEGRARLKAEAEALRTAMGNDPNVVVITHKALARYMNDDRVRHWGTHKGHNDWKGRKRLILWGLPLMNANDQIIGYKTYRAAMVVRGIDLPDWNGERVRDWVATDGWDIYPAAKLPAVKEARDWLLREINAHIFQAVGRLRAVWATEPVQIEIYGFLPIVGFGLKVNEIRLERSGRTFKKTNTTQAVASGIIELGEQRTRAKLVAYVHRKTGVHISNATADSLVNEIRVQALQAGITLDAAARAACGVCTRMLDAGHAPSVIAQAAIDLDLPAVAAVAAMLDQCRRAPGALRAGP